jgi:1-acyl-sn-glycerol-3-phosphate acyltransferase
MSAPAKSEAASAVSLADEAGGSAPPLTTAIAWVRSLATYVGLGLYVTVAGPPGMLLAFAFRWKGLLYVLGHLGVRLGLSLSGIRYQVSGREHIPPNRPVVFCANHQSNIDPPVLFDALHPRLHVLYKAELSRIPLFGRAIQLGGFIPVARQNREQSMAAIARGAASIRSGNSFLIFPEGTRSRTTELLPFKKGGFVMALEAEAPIVPVSIMGGRAAMRKGSGIIRPVTISIRIGTPVETAGLGVGGRDRVIRDVRAQIEHMLRAGPLDRETTSTRKHENTK